MTTQRCVPSVARPQGMARRRKAAISMQLNPICKAPFDVVHRERPLRMPRDLHALPGGEIAINLPPRFAKFLLNCLKRPNQGRHHARRSDSLNPGGAVPAQRSVFQIERLPSMEVKKLQPLKELQSPETRGHVQSCPF